MIKKLFCSHGVPVDDKHYCNQCSKSGLLVKKNYEGYLKMLDEEIEGYSYMLEQAEWRKEQFIERYGKVKLAQKPNSKD